MDARGSETWRTSGEQEWCLIAVGSVIAVMRELQAEGARTRRGKPFDKGTVYKLLHNRVYAGDAVHKGTTYPGEHAAIVDRDSFTKAPAILATNGRARGANIRNDTPALRQHPVKTAGTTILPT